MVKNAHIETEGTIMKIKHYKTFLVEYDTKTQIAHVKKGLSPISNKQITYFIEAFNPKEIINDNEGFKLFAKNEFSKPLDQ